VFAVVPGDNQGNNDLLDLYFDIDANSWRSWNYLAKSGLIGGNNYIKSQSEGEADVSSIATSFIRKRVADSSAPSYVRKLYYFEQFYSTKATIQLSFLMEMALMK
jgi:hypothetical protein